MTTQALVARFDELAQQEKWFEIQDELFADDAKSTDPAHSPYFGYAEGREAIRKKGMDFVSTITAGHRVYTSAPIVTGNHFAVAREIDVTSQEFGRVQINQIMLYEVKDGKIISEKFFY